MYPTEQFWNDKFKNEEYFYGTEPNEFLKNNAQIFKTNSKILSLGDGEGRNSVFLAKMGHSATAADASSTGLEKLKILAEKSGVNVFTRHEDVVTGEWEKENWDAVINIFCHLHSEDRFIVYKKIQHIIMQSCNS